MLPPWIAVPMSDAVSVHIWFCNWPVVRTPPMIVATKTARRIAYSTDVGPLSSVKRCFKRVTSLDIILLRCGWDVVVASRRLLKLMSQIDLAKERMNNLALERRGPG